MNALKARVFRDLVDPMTFRTTKGFEERNVTRVRTFGCCTYFSGDSGTWFVVTPPCKVLAANVNTFRNGEHMLKLQCPSEWADSVTIKLKEAVRLACKDTDDFESFWKQMHLPNFQALEIRGKYTTNRKNVYDYVNIYNKDLEVTGKCQICTGSVVQCSIRFEFARETHDTEVYASIACKFGAGIRVLCLGGRPEPIKRPWDWSNVDFDTLSVPMYDHLRVKTGAMGVTSVCGRVATVEPKHAFEDAIRDFHARAGADAWDNRITVNKSIRPDCVAVATVVPSRSNTHITWTASDLATASRCPQKRQKTHGASVTPAVKTDGDNTDNCADSRTSGEYT